MSLDPTLVVPGLVLLAILCLCALAIAVMGGFSGAAIVLLILGSRRANRRKADRQTTDAREPGSWWEELAKSAGPDRENL